MFSKNNGYSYEQPETQLFQRQLPYKSIKIPYRKDPIRVLKYSQQKYELEQLREQIMSRCKFEELQYLEMMKKQRQVMEEDIKKRKQLIEIGRMEEIIEQNKKIHQRNEKKIKDSLDKLEKEQEQKRFRAKSERSPSAYSSEMSSLNDPYIKTIRPESKKQEVILMEQLKQGKDIATAQMKKEEEIQKIKKQMMEKYKFIGEAGKKARRVEEVEDKTMVDWWIKKVRQFREEEHQRKAKEPEPEPSESSESDSEDNNIKRKNKGKK